MKDVIVSYGEIMGRFSPDNNRRFRQTMPGNLNVTFAGAESSVVVSLQLLGCQTRYVTALPKHSIADACEDSVRRFGVDTSYILRTDKGRLGLYFMETGANQRPSQVIYDRADSSVSLTPGDSYDWKNIFADAKWFHISGITQAISREAAEASILAARHAKDAGVTVSCDLNFRKKLWNWEAGTNSRDLAEKTMRRLLKYVDVVIGNEEDAHDVLGIQAGDTDVEAGDLDINRYPDVARQIQQQFSHVSHVAITLRESISANHNNWGAMLYTCKDGSAHFAPMDGDGYKPYEIRNIVDRLGGGDSFSAGLIYGLSGEFKDSPGDALEFAVASSCLCHSIEGDFNYSSYEEVTALKNGSTTGRVKR
ncbi:sugar kinase [Oceanispirochaeta sp.]|jgi:2-dehydro-3-deoxygluconokinase|uniref:sugar kinase n=1 Tax=Oceanispirochaeta sp. TaxID=2035350 RepID=UPI00262130C7|nr:sugar kinase [Oceanispirochaeta sp.]MDA3955138.1 sugar kinase [Oceanispirochaeta sp.]